MIMSKIGPTVTPNKRRNISAKRIKFIDVSYCTSSLSFKKRVNINIVNSENQIFQLNGLILFVDHYDIFLNGETRFSRDSRIL